MADTTRLTDANDLGGLWITVSNLLTAKPVGTIVLNALDNNIYRSTNAAVATYTQLNQPAGIVGDGQSITFGTGLDVVLSADGTDLNVAQGAGGGAWTFQDALVVNWGTGKDVTFTANGADLDIGQGGGGGGVTFLDTLPVNFGSGKDLIVTGDGTNVVFSNTAAALALWHDDVFTVADQADTTRRFQFSVGGIAAATLRTWTVPNYNLDFGTAVMSQTLGADPGTGAAIPVATSAHYDLTIGTGAETNTLAIPTAIGQRISLSAATVGMGGTRAVTAASAINQAGNTIMTFAQASDFIELTAISLNGALAWRVAANDGVALS